jgi:hypothetical protein
VLRAWRASRASARAAAAAFARRALARRALRALRRNAAAAEAAREKGHMCRLHARRWRVHLPFAAWRDACALAAARRDALAAAREARGRCVLRAWAAAVDEANDAAAEGAKRMS